MIVACVCVCACVYVHICVCVWDRGRSIDELVFELGSERTAGVLLTDKGSCLQLPSGVSSSVLHGNLCVAAQLFLQGKDSVPIWFPTPFLCEPAVGLFCHLLTGV